MDIETRHEFDRLRRGFSDALEQVAAASDEDAELTAWRRIQMVAWELNELLPAAGQHPGG